MPNSKLKTLFRRQTGKNLELRRGFTLIELMIAMGVFVLLIGIVVNIFITSLQRQQSVVALMTANDNASLAIEQMAREIRTGSGFSMDQPGMPLGALQFTNASGVAVTYQWNNDAIERKAGAAVLFMPITSSNVSVSNLGFRIVDLGPSWPTRIVINVQVNFSDRFLKAATNNLQTTVSAREI